jgi:hypothetical protein
MITAGSSETLPFGSVEVRHFFTDEIELEQLIEFAQRMIATHSFI